MKQTAVQWLLENLITEPYSEKHFEHNSQCWDKAEKMEKEVIIHLLKWIRGNVDEVSGGWLYFNKKYTDKEIIKVYQKENNKK